MITEVLVWALVTAQDPKAILHTDASQANCLEDPVALEQQHFGEHVRCVLRYSVSRPYPGRYYGSV